MSAPGEPGKLSFKYWPFDIVPVQGGKLIWADRKALKASLDRLGQRLRRHQAVSLHLLWADFGAGKTHALLYFKQEIESGNFGGLLALYSALPKGCREFLDIYRSVVRAITAEQLSSAYAASIKLLGQKELHSRLDKIWPNLSKCFHSIAIGNDEQRSTALAWLHAEGGVSLKQLQGLSITSRIRSTDEAVLALTGIVRLFNSSGFSRVIFMVDEFQRVEALRRQQQDEINAGLHGFFNNCGSGMSLIVSFSFGLEENIRHFLNAELLSRADPIRLSIPALSLDEGNEFLGEIVSLARDPEEPWPVTDDALPAIVKGVHAKLKLTPRRLVKAAGLVFDFAIADIEAGGIQSLSAAYVEDMIQAGHFDRIDDGDD
jgi:hypothetical protein